LDDHCNAQLYGTLGLQRDDWEQFLNKGITVLQ
jgi:hypothetical protein